MKQVELQTYIISNYLIKKDREKSYIDRLSIGEILLGIKNNSQKR